MFKIIPIIMPSICADPRTRQVLSAIFAKKPLKGIFVRHNFNNADPNMNKQVIRTGAAPAPIGPYSQAVFAGDTLYISGQICIDPVTGEVNNADIRTETRQCMQNLQAILEEAGLAFANVVKTGIFLTDMKQFGEVNEVYGSFLRDPFPARETVEVSALPKFVHVEISMIAVRTLK